MLKSKLLNFSAIIVIIYNYSSLIPRLLVAQLIERVQLGLSYTNFRYSEFTLTINIGNYLKYCRNFEQLLMFRF